MYLGQIVEQGTKHEIYRQPLHPYTQGLMAAVPRPGEGRRRRLPAIKGTVPLPINLPDRCRFFERCPRAKVGVCDVGVPRSHAPAAQGGAGRGVPPLTEIANGHWVRCHRAGENV